MNLNLLIKLLKYFYKIVVKILLKIKLYYLKKVFIILNK